MALLLVMLSSCSPEAPWTTKDVEITMDIKTVSAGFIEIDFSTNKNAYYLIAIEEARKDYDPMKHQKQFMALALDSANTDYIQWKHELLKNGEYFVAPFASHSLQYGNVSHFFTGLWFETKYWVYAFVVNPETMQPVGKLYLKTITTEFESIMPIRFEYRVKGYWDYVYPIDSTSGNVYAQFPYISITRDSLDIVKDITKADTTDIFAYLTSPQEYFTALLLNLFMKPDEADVLYGVSATEKDGYSSNVAFEKGHTYYTFIGGYDFSIRQNTLYKFRWDGEQTNLYFTDDQNIAMQIDTIITIQDK